jgi:antitoxin YefM
MLHRPLYPNSWSRLACQSHHSGLEERSIAEADEAEAVLLSIDDLEGLEMTLEILDDTQAVARISESLAALGRGEEGVDLATVRADLVRRRLAGA